MAQSSDEEGIRETEERARIVTMLTGRPRQRGLSAIRGWVYVISNPAMPGLVKIGYSTKDPELRARELDHTGSPHPYVVDYELLTENPRGIEQRSHGALRGVREGREWFRCSVEHAIVAIRESLQGAPVHLETYKRADRQRAETMLAERRAEEARRERVEAVIAGAQLILKNQFEELLKRNYPPLSFTPYWVGWSIAAAIVALSLEPKGSVVGVIILILCVGAACAGLHRSIATDRQRGSVGYKEAIQKHDANLAEVRTKVEKKYGVTK